MAPTGETRTRPRFTPSARGLTGNTVHRSVRIPAPVAAAVEAKLAQSIPDVRNWSDVLNDAVGLWLVTEG